MATEIVSLSWRDSGKTAQDILTDLKRLADTLDQNRDVQLVSLESKKKKLGWTADGYRAWVRERQPLVKKVAPSSAQRLGDNKYLGRMSMLLSFLLPKIGSLASNASRAWDYQIASEGITIREAKKILSDVTLSVGLHPFLLGIQPESKGRVHLPPGLRLEFKRADNALMHANGSLPFTKVLDNERLVLTLLLDAPIKILRGTIKTVLVSEHRNLSTFLEGSGSEWDHRFDDVLFVLTGGYPDMWTREFLFLLWKELEKRNTGARFLYVGDCDAHGLEIFHLLAYGSERCAYVSAQMICPGLRWYGVNDKAFRHFLKGHAARHVARLDPSKVNIVNERARAALAADGAMRVLETERNCRATPKEKALVDKMLRNEYFPQLGEPEALVECRRMAQEGAYKVRFWNLASPDPVGPRSYLAEAIALAHGDVVLGDPKLKFWGYGRGEVGAGADDDWEPNTGE